MRFYFQNDRNKQKCLIHTIPPPKALAHSRAIRYFLAQIIFISFALLFVACSSNQPQYVNSRDYTSFGLDNHDIDDKVQKIAKSLLNSRIIKSQKEPKVLAIGAIDDDTSDGIDTEIIATELIKHISDSEKFLVVNAGRDKKVEEMIRDARNLRKDAEYNQYTTIEQGNLISPNYALTGKIIERTKSVGEDEIKEYVFVFKLTDLMRGVVRWVGTERISKKLPKSEVVQTQSYTHSFTPSYSYTPSYSQDDDSDLWEDVKEFFSFGAEGRNHFILGVDFGFGAVKINSMWIDYIYDTAFAMPINVRIGYLRNIGDNWAFALNFLYNYMYVSSFDGYELEVGTKLTHTIQRIGGELLIYYNTSDWLHIYVGGGVLKDFGSKYKLLFKTYKAYNDTYDKLEQKIDSWYPLVKFGILWNVNNYIGVNSDVTCSWALNEENYLGTNCALVLGLQLKI